MTGYESKTLADSILLKTSKTGENGRNSDFHKSEKSNIIINYNYEYYKTTNEDMVSSFSFLYYTISIVVYFFCIIFICHIMAISIRR
jgi:hypothetical protein